MVIDFELLALEITSLIPDFIYYLEVLRQKWIKMCWKLILMTK